MVLQSNHVTGVVGPARNIIQGIHWSMPTNQPSFDKVIPVLTKVIITLAIIILNQILPIISVSICLVNSTFTMTTSTTSSQTCIWVSKREVPSTKLRSIVTPYLSGSINPTTRAIVTIVIVQPSATFVHSVGIRWVKYTPAPVRRLDVIVV